MARFIEAILWPGPVSLNDWPGSPRRPRAEPGFVYRSIRGTKRPGGRVLNEKTERASLLVSAQLYRVPFALGRPLVGVSFPLSLSLWQPLLSSEE